MSFLSFFLNDFKFFLPEIFLATSILSLTLYCSLVATSRELGFPVMVKSLNKLCLLVLFFTFLLVGNEQGCFQVVYQNTFIFDGLTAKAIKLPSIIEQRIVTARPNIQHNGLDR